MPVNPADQSLPEALRNMANDGRISTHYEGCWRFHLKCAAMYAADVIEDLLEDAARQS